MDDILTGPAATDQHDDESIAAEPPARKIKKDARYAWFAVLGLTVLAGVGYGWNLVHFGVNYYYAAAANTMAHSWRLFWFAGYDPTGTVTVDKLPGGMWVQSLSIRIFGLSTASVVTPVVVAGVACVPAIFVAVRRLAGPRVGLLAAAILAVTPATGIMSRGNTQDVFCVLLLILATGAASQAIKTGRWLPLLLSAVYVGLAFQAKMLEAWAVLPGLGLAYLIAAPGGVRRRIGRLAVALTVTVAVSLAWMIAITLTPAADRPYTDGSQNNSVFAQVFVYNGVERFTHDPAYGLGNQRSYSPSARQIESYRRMFDIPSTGSASDAGWSRLLVHDVGRDAGWLLPAALLALIGGLIARRRAPRTDLLRAGLIAWGCWLVIFAVALSGGRILLSYYTGMLVAPIAAISAVGLRMLWRALIRRRTGAGLRAVLIGAIVVTVGTEAVVSYDADPWLPGIVVLAGLVAVLLSLVVRQVAAGAPHRRRVTASIAAAALLAGPAAATGNFIASAGGEWDFPQSAKGTYVQKLHTSVAAGQLAGISMSSVYGSAYMPETNASTWTSFVSTRGFFDAVPAGRSVLIFTGAEASAWLLTGAPQIRVIGGYTGLVNYPDLTTVRGWVTSGSVQWAIVPGSGDIRANDPRVLMIKDLCKPQFQYGALGGIAPIIYRCDRLST